MEKTLAKLRDICKRGKLDVLARNYQDECCLVLRIYEHGVEDLDAACFLSLRFRDEWTKGDGGGVGKRPMTKITQPCSDFSFIQQNWADIGDISWAGLCMPTEVYEREYAGEYDPAIARLLSLQTSGNGVCGADDAEVTPLKGEKVAVDGLEITKIDVTGTIHAMVTGQALVRQIQAK